MPSLPRRALAALAALALAGALGAGVAPAPSAVASAPNATRAPWATGPPGAGVAPPVDRHGSQPTAGTAAAGQVDLVVRPAAGGGRRAAATSAARSARRAVSGLAGATVAAHEHTGVAVVSLAADRAARARARLAAQPGVAAVQRDPAVRVLGTDSAETASHGDAVEPDDPRYSSQWAAERVAAPLAWAHSTGAESVTVAVLDTGVDADHPDLAGAVVGGTNVSGDGAESEHDDVHGHGTHVAGIAAARTDNATGVAGMCWTCSILSVKVLGDDGSGSQADVAEGVRWAVDAGADVLVMSFGGTGTSPLLADAVADAQQAGVLMVAAAGNAGADEPTYPAAFPEVIAVGAVDDDDARATFSNHGDWVELAAPGVGVASTISETNTATGCDLYCQASGTSAATPVVGGAAGLALALESAPPASAIRQTLRDTAVDVGGWLAGGRIDAGAAIGVLAQAGSDDDGSGDDGSDAPASLEDGTARTAGSQRFATAAALSAETFDPGVEQAYLATGGAFADALSAGAVAGAVDAPVLLATPERLPEATRDELARLAPGELVVVGGPTAIAPAVQEAAAQAAGAASRRLAGSQRFATAAAVAREAFDPGLDTAYVATGQGFADALAGVPAAVADGAPMLLTARDRLPGATREALAALAPGEIVVLGGPSAVSPQVADELAGLAGSAGVQRVAGDDRFATAAAIAGRFDAAPAAFLATGADFPDALAGGPVAAHYASPLLLATSQELPAPTRTQLQRLEPSHVRLLGGPGVLGDALRDVLDDLLGLLPLRTRTHAG